MGLQGFPRVQRDSIVAVPRQAAPTAPEDSTKGRLHSPTAIHAPEDITALQAPQAITSAPEGE